MYKKKISSIKPNVLEAMFGSPWKGNIRELGNILERGVLLAENETLTLDCLNIECRPPTGKDAVADTPSLSLKQVVDEAEKKAILQALRAANNNRSMAARLLGISRRAFYDKMTQYNLEA